MITETNGEGLIRFTMSLSEYNKRWAIAGIVVGVAVASAYMIGETVQARKNKKSSK